MISAGGLLAAQRADDLCPQPSARMGRRVAGYYLAVVDAVEVATP